MTRHSQPIQSSPVVELERCVQVYRWQCDLMFTFSAMPIVHTTIDLHTGKVGRATRTLRLSILFANRSRDFRQQFGLRVLLVGVPYSCSSMCESRGYAGQFARRMTLL